MTNFPPSTLPRHWRNPHRYNKFIPINLFRAFSRYYRLLYLRGSSTSSLSHFREPYGAACGALMRICCVLSLALRGCSTSSLSRFREPYPMHVGKYDLADNRPKLAMLAANFGYQYWTDDRSRLG